MSQKTITVGTIETPVDLDINFGNSQDNFTELYGWEDHSLAGYQPAIGEDDNYVTDAEKVIIGDTSGTNSGDQDISGLADKAITTAIKAVAYTIGTDDADEAYGGVIYMSTTDTLTLPAIAVGMSVSILATAAVALTLDPDGTEKILLDGVDATAGVTIVSPGDIGDMAVLTYYGAGVWYAATNDWTAGA